MFLANENFPNPSIRLLRENGFTVISIQEKCPGISDVEVLKMAIDSDLIILTFDRDYGELIFRYSNEAPPAVIYFRETGNNPLYAGQTILRLVYHTEIKIKNSFTVIEEQNIRQRFYP